MFFPVANLALLFFYTKSIYYSSDIVKKREITVSVTFSYTKYAHSKRKKETPLETTRRVAR